jgi:hypothetical protein
MSYPNVLLALAVAIGALVFGLQGADVPGLGPARALGLTGKIETVSLAPSVNAKHFTFS